MLSPVLAALLSAGCSTAKDVISKRLAPKIDGTISTFASFAYALPYYAVFLALTWLLGFETFAVAPGFLYWVVLRSLSDSFAEWFKMHAFQYGDLSLVSSIFSLYPVLLLFIAPFITGDRITLAGAIGVIITIAGTLVILYRPRNSATPIHPKALLFAFGAAVFFSLNTCFDRLAAQSASPGLSAFAMTFLAGVFLLPLLRGKGQALSQLRDHQGLLWQRGFFEIAFMVIKLYALQHLQAAYVVGLQRVGVLFSVVSGKLVFNEEEFVKRLIGAMLIVVGVVVIAIQ